MTMIGYMLIRPVCFLFKRREFYILETTILVRSRQYLHVMGCQTGPPANCFGERRAFEAGYTPDQRARRPATGEPPVHPHFLPGFLPSAPGWACGGKNNDPFLCVILPTCFGFFPQNESSFPRWERLRQFRKRN